MRATTTRAVPQCRVISDPAHQEGCWQEGRAVSGCLRLSRRRCSDTCPIRDVQSAVESAETTSDQRCTRTRGPVCGYVWPWSPPSPEDLLAERVLPAGPSAVQPEQLSQGLALPLAAALLLQAPDGFPGRVPSPGTCPHCPKDGNTATKTEIVPLLTRQGCLLSSLCSGLSACQASARK